MKSTVDGVTYDTDVASRVCLLRMPNDETTLYRMPDGMWFYDIYDLRKDDHLLAPATADEAERFCKLAGVELIDNVFGVPEKGRV